MSIKSKYYIACSIDDHYVSQLIVFLTSLFENNKKDSFHTFILTESLVNSSKEIIDNLKFKYPKHIIDILYLDSDRLDGVIVNGHISKATYYRILLPEIISEEIEKILYLDVDIIVKGNIKTFWDLDLYDFSHLAVVNMGIDESFKMNLGMSPFNPYFNAGVLMINLNWWREHSVSQKSFEFITKYPDKVTLWDQDVLNVVLEEKWKEIPFEFNAQEQIFREDMKIQYPIRNFLDSYYNPIIIHYTGGGHSKPWFKECRHELKNEYIYYYYKSRRFHVKTDKWLYFLGRDIKLNHITVFLILLQRFTRKLRYFFHLQKIKYFI